MLGVCRKLEVFVGQEWQRCLSEVRWRKQDQRWLLWGRWSSCSACWSHLQLRGDRAVLDKTSAVHHWAGSCASSELFYSHWAQTDSSSYCFNAVQIVFVSQSGLEILTTVTSARSLGVHAASKMSRPLGNSKLNVWQSVLIRLLNIYSFVRMWKILCFCLTYLVLFMLWLFLFFLVVWYMP